MLEKVTPLVYGQRAPHIGCIAAIYDGIRSPIGKDAVVTAIGGKALLSLADYLGIPEKNTFAIGDSDNDISMIESAAYGIAVGNATESVKAVASYITANYDSLGFAKAVYEYIIPLVQKF